jgi:ADP-ribosylglycohydrolase/protein-tyrosine phosphatase
MAAKTSESHPLRIDAVGITGVDGKIGLTFCPGKKQASALTGVWDRNLDIDLDRIRDFGAKALVTLMEDSELEKVRVPGKLLESKSVSRGIDWHHLPIKDVHIPDESFETLWTYTGARLRRHLIDGENLVLHCMGGLGRTGTIAARLLVELGVNPENAVQEIRMARPGSIETSEQEKYVRKQQAIVQPGDRDGGAIPGIERTLGCLLGGAVGDAFGYAVEFDSISNIRRKFGRAGIREPSLTDGKLVVSDDTQMTLFTLEGILKGLEKPSPSIENFVESIRFSYLDWLGTQGESHGSRRKGKGWLAHCAELQVRRDPGMTCTSSLRHSGHGTIGGHLNDSKGCGGAMRSAPVGLFRRFKPRQAFDLGARSAAITHGHPSGYLSAGMVSAMVRCLMDGMDIHAAIEESVQILKGWDGYEETLGAVTMALDVAASASKDHSTIIHSIGGGWVGEEALAIALYAVLAGRSYVEVVRIASNHDGDSDSTASIAGQIWGAWKGLMEIPHAWISKLDVLVPLLRLAQEALDSAQLA